MKEDISQNMIESYNVIAEHHVETVFAGVFNEFYERPVVYSLLGNVDGKRVLDAGCGPGHYAEWLIAHGATVLAIDSSPSMVQLARQRLGAAAEVRQADLNVALDEAASGSFDIVLAALVLDYVEDWDTLFSEFSRLLAPHGRFIFSVHHPIFLDLKIAANIEESYFDVEQLEEDWLPFGLTIPAYRRPLGAMALSLWKAGFWVEQIIEPRPIEACRDAYPEWYARLSKHPVFICFSAAKRS